MAVAVTVAAAFAGCKKDKAPVDNQYEIELAKLTAMYPKFRTDLENAKTKPNDMTDAFNTTFNRNGGTTAKNANDSIEAALPTAQYYLNLCDEYNADFNKANHLVLQSTCEAALAQKKIVEELQKP